ncbi:MAG: HAD-IIB family hydrolase [Candidatus Moeniiplasma glomeromycotorum]|nr:HAD-IIB family hydrolase [Candidatus Moeniiplasma glomeromycotorum]MCE8167239.1 HAD-IIB family hydrolase [Candidatus Moeniiplasma glomeromycotorum]MCE8168748.1 HAD-IIB family hydrolase [Candidatus Moeniiplasma glomeromycotorum]
MNIVSPPKEKHLIKLDIDGTSTNPDFSTLNPKLKTVLQKLKAQGQIICFTTGRNYASALPFYKEVGLDTFLVTYNGAYINNPSDKNNQEIVVFHSIKNNLVKEILNEPIIKENILNVLIDHVNGLKANGEIDLKTISTSDDIYYREIFFNNNPYTKGEDILPLLGKKDVLQLVLEFPKEEKIFNEILLVLRRKYSDAITFYFGSKLKAKNPGDKILVPDPERKIIKIRNGLASKGMGAKWVAQQHNINLHNVIAFGNDVNDIELVHSVGKGIVTADSNDYLKTYAYGITDFGLFNSDGVAKFLTDYFSLERKNV